MELQGKIEKFNVPDIFQQLTTDKRTGTLGIIRNNQATMFYFKNGRITYAYTPSNRNRVGERLIEKGFIDNAALEKALTKQNEDGGKNRLGKILIEDKKINEQQLATILTDQISDIVHKVMSWDKGLFKFYDDKFPTAEEDGLSLPTEDLILEGAKRADELNKLRDKLPDFNTYLRLKKSSVDRKTEIKLTAGQWDILTLCDGNHAIDDIISKSDDDPEPIMKTIIKLIESGMIEPCKPAGLKAGDSTSSRSIKLFRPPDGEKEALPAGPMKGENSKERFLDSLSYQLNVMECYSDDKYHLFSVVGQLLKNLEKKPDIKTNHLAASILYFLKLNGYKVAPYVEKLRELSRNQDDG